MPDRHEQIRDAASWTYTFVCVACGEEHRQVDPTPPERWSEDPNATRHVPGTRPPAPVRDPDEWQDAERLTSAEKALVRDSWKMVDQLRGELTIHKVNYIWRIKRALLAQDVAALVSAAVEYVNLLDYEAIHGKESNTYFGTEGDSTAIRSDLDQIAQARELRGHRGRVALAGCIVDDVRDEREAFRCGGCGAGLDERGQVLEEGR